MLLSFAAVSDASLEVFNWLWFDWLEAAWRPDVGQVARLWIAKKQIYPINCGIGYKNPITALTGKWFSNHLDRIGERLHISGIGVESLL